MFKCSHCETEFEEAVTRRELSRIYLICPVCGFDEIAEHKLVDYYGDFIYTGDKYYDFGNNEYVTEDNLADYLADCEVIAK